MKQPEPRYAREKPSSVVNRELLGPLYSGTLELLDHPKLAAQLVGLERRLARGGRESIDRAPSGHDDLANAAAGALHLVLARKRGATWEHLCGNGGVYYDEHGCSPNLRGSGPTFGPGWDEAGHRGRAQHRSNTC